MIYVFGLGLLIILLSYWRYLHKRQDPKSYRYSIYLALLITLVALVYLALSGRLLWIVGVFAAWLPWVRHAIAFKAFMKRAKAYRDKFSNSQDQANPQSSKGQLTKKEALDILGLGDDANKDDVLQAHGRLIKRLHPDVEGSDYLASLVNQARDVLIKQ